MIRTLLATLLLSCINIGILNVSATQATPQTTTSITTQTTIHIYDHASKTYDINFDKEEDIRASNRRNGPRVGSVAFYNGLSSAYPDGEGSYFDETVHVICVFPGRRYKSDPQDVLKVQRKVRSNQMIVCEKALEIQTKFTNPALPEFRIRYKLLRKHCPKGHFLPFIYLKGDAPPNKNAQLLPHGSFIRRGGYYCENTQDGTTPLDFI